MTELSAVCISMSPDSGTGNRNGQNRNATSMRALRQGSHQDGNLLADDEIKVYGWKLGPGNAAFVITTWPTSWV